MPSLVRSLSIIAVLVLGSCAHGDLDDAPPERRATDAVRALLQMQQDAWNRGDIPDFMEGYWKSDDLVFTSGGRIRRGWQATLEGYRRGYTKETMGQLTFEDLELTPLGEDAVLVLGRWGLQGLAEPAGALFTLVVRRIDGRWRVVHDHTSSDEPRR